MNKLYLVQMSYEIFLLIPPAVGYVLDRSDYHPNVSKYIWNNICRTIDTFDMNWINVK